MQCRMLLCCIALVLAACADKPVDDALFPLAPGRSWTYRVSTAIDDDGATQHEALVLSNRGAEAIDGSPAWRRRSDSGIEYWLRSDASGIYRVAARSPPDADPRADHPPRYVLRSPIAVGTEWQASTAPYVLARKNEVPREVRRTHKDLPMRYRIAALGQTVQTPAGTFDKCVRVDGRAEVHLYVDATLQWRDIPLDTSEWYCPNVGLVRLERKEPSPSRFMLGGTVTMELMAWQ